MVETHEHFVKRLDTLGRKHKKMTRGYVTKVTKDGLIVVQPKKGGSGHGLLALKILMLALIGFVSFKAITLASVGPVTYNERLSKLENGTVIEQMGAKALAIDPITQAVAGSVAPVLK